MKVSATRLRALLSVPALAAFLLPSSALAEPSLGELFQRGKTESRMGSYERSLATFQELDQLSRQSGNESERVKLEPLIAFYRGVNLAALGQKDAARKEFEIYLASFPGARLDPAMFPKAAVELFDKTRENARAQRPGAVGRSGTQEESPIQLDYSRFRPEANPPAVFGQKWAEGAIRFLMTKQETSAWQRLADDRERAEFVTKFWQRRDPNPLTAENEFRDEIERRIQFADKRFDQGEKRGSETDRGLVFVLLGPPSYIGQKPFKSEDDPVQAARAAPDQEIRFNPDGSKTVVLHPRTGLTAETLQGTREIWYYRRDRLPKVVKFPEVDFEFITRKGFGTAVLQRDHEVLVTLDLVARSTLPPED